MVGQLIPSLPYVIPSTSVLLPAVHLLVQLQIVTDLDHDLLGYVHRAAFLQLFPQEEQSLCFLCYLHPEQEQF